MVTEGLTFAFTTSVIVFDIAVVDVKQPLPVIVIVQVTASLLSNDAVE